MKQRVIQNRNLNSHIDYNPKDAENITLGFPWDYIQFLFRLNQGQILPEKMTPSGVGSKKQQQQRGSTTRYSILSDPRLSQLFALSSQLEALAQSIDVQPSAKSTQSGPKKCSNNNHMMTSALMSSSTPQSTSDHAILDDQQETSVKYRRLQDEECQNNTLGKFFIEDSLLLDCFLLDGETVLDMSKNAQSKTALA